jgi:hypothetical protein
VPHAEVYVGNGGETIRISCDCDLSVDHDYDQWVAMSKAAHVRRSSRSTR